MLSTPAKEMSSDSGLRGAASGCCSHPEVIITARVILMNSSFRSIAARAPRTLSATSADPRFSTQLVSSMMAASRASWFSLILYSREGSRSEFGIADPPWKSQRSSWRSWESGEFWRFAERRACERLVFGVPLQAAM